ncbi:MAG: hypothetical protein H6832_18805 [Planctomycetes bacterium]|nr:hypothetical protein [Planctomycetota bacterium]MCB9920460.1 hypothetical protein [Planctomycetota bacterium]
MSGVVQGILIATAGIVVFAVSVLGMLAASGRLNADGVKGVPVLNQILKEEEPPTGGDTKRGGEKTRGTAGKGKGVATEAGFRKPQDATAQGDAGGQDKARLDPRGMDAVRRKMFEFESFGAPTSAKELERLQQKLSETVHTNELQTAALSKSQLELEIREKDLTYRRESIQKLMDEVERRIETLRSMREQFERDVTVLTREEARNVKRQAEQLGAMEPPKAAELLLELGLDKEDLAVKLLVSMDVEQASGILAMVDAKRGARLIERATRVLRRD